MLGHGLNVNKNGLFGYVGILDRLGIVNNAIAAFSLFLLTGLYNGNCISVRRSIDNDILDIGFTNAGFINVDALENFCGIGNGFVTTKYNQSILTGVQNAIQLNPAIQPQIVNAGNFIANGIQYNGSSTYLNIPDYLLLNIQNPAFSIYVNYIKRLTHIGMLFSKNLNVFNATQYALYTAATGNCNFVLEGIPRVVQADGAGGTVNKVMATWAGVGANQTHINVNAIENNSTYNVTPLTYRSKNTIGADEDGGYNDFFDGEMTTLIIFNNSQRDNFPQLAAAV